MISGANGQILSVVAGVPTWITSTSVPVTSVFGRIGSVTATIGDYTTSLVTE